LYKSNADLAREGVVSLDLYEEMLEYVVQRRGEAASVAASDIAD